MSTRNDEYKNCRNGCAIIIVILDQVITWMPGKWHYKHHAKNVVIVLLFVTALSLLACYRILKVIQKAPIRPGKK